MELKNKINAILNCDDFSSVSLQLRDLEFDKFPSKNIYSINNKLKKLQNKEDIKIAYLSNFTIEFLPAYVNVLLAAKGIKSRYYISPYNQYFQEVLTKESNFNKFMPDIIFLSLSIRQLAPDIVHNFSSHNKDDSFSVINRILSELEEWDSLVQRKTKAYILISNFPFPAYPQKGIADVNENFGEMDFYYELNKFLLNKFRGNSRTNILDLAKLYTRFGSLNIFEPKMYYLAKIMWNEAFLPMLSKELVRWIHAIKGLTKKCIILDLDNTLWKGILGEDGPNGIKIGYGDPESEAFLDFQINLKSLKDRGIMLSICSKNNENDVLEAFELRKEMPLKIADFTAMRINWENKHINVQQIAEELNIGLESIVFIDDNPVECGLIEQMLPEVMTIQCPSNPEKLYHFLDEFIEFDKTIVLQDDKTKTEQYIQLKKREEYKKIVGNLEDFLNSLNTAINIKAPTKQNIERIHQLFTKTNQFNLTTIRYSSGDIEQKLTDKKFDLKIVSASDRFGDLGIIGLYLIKLSEEKVYIDSFILSCRAMGRGIESAIMNYLKRRFQKNKQVSIIESEYIPTAKNKPVEFFYDEQNFNFIEKTKGGKKKYQLSLDDTNLVSCTWIKVIEDEN